MKRPKSATQGPKRNYIGNKGKDQNKIMILPESLPNIQYSNYSDALDDELSLLYNSWDDLGVTNEYRMIFISLARKVNELERKDMITQEKSNLKKFRDALLNLKKEIANREENLLKLKALNKDLENINTEDDEKNKILQKVISLIKSLRLNAVNIVTRFIKVKQSSAYYSKSGKWDVTKIRPDYSYDPKYLFKMKNDLLFLKNSKLSLYIEMNNSELDAFLTNCAPSSNEINNNNDKITIPIRDDIMKLITESRYALLQETVLSSVDSNEKMNMNLIRNEYYGGKVNRGLSAYKVRNLEEEKYRVNNLPYKINNLSNINNNSKKKSEIIQRGQPKNMNRYIHEIKTVKGG